MENGHRYNQFIKEMNHEDRSVLEQGTLRSLPDRSTHRQSLFPKCKDYVKTDIGQCIDVDVVSDAHKMGEVFGANSFDGVLSCSVFEHLERPWIAAESIREVLKPRGLVFIQTHQTFPIHGYPSDYYRFSKEALKSLFGPASGFEVISSGYSYPCTISFSEGQEPLGCTTARDSENHCWLNVSILSRKVKENNYGKQRKKKKRKKETRKANASGKEKKKKR